MKEKLQSFGFGVLGLAILVGLLLLYLLLIEGAAWLSAAMYPWLVGLNGLAVAATIFLFLPNAIFSSTPRFAGGGLMISSYIFGATLWVWSFLLTYLAWGGLGLAIGLFLAGVGVVPLAMIAMLFKAEWLILGQLALLLILTFGARVWGYRLLEKAQRSALS